MNQTLHDCIAGRISPQIAVAHFMFNGNDAAAIKAALDAAALEHKAALDAAALEHEPHLAQAEPHPQLDAIRTLLVTHTEQIDALTAHIGQHGADHDASGDTPEQGVARIADFFDRAVAASPEASVALYSLGDPLILAAATAEIVEWLEMSDLLAPDAEVLDLGCGIGRVAGALAPRCRSVFGLDVSPGMVAEARRRHADEPNLRFEVTAGHNLGFLPADSFDLILAIDSFPYLVQAGIVPAHLADAARILRPGGALVVLNLSYETDEWDEAQAPIWAAESGLTLVGSDRQPFRLWDGSAFVFRR